jgi:protein ImuB
MSGPPLDPTSPRVERITCVHVHSFSLQLLLRLRPSWREGPVAVVAEDRPHAPILALNRLAAQEHVTVGMRYAAARGLLPTLKAAAILPEQRAHLLGELFLALNDFSPRVEPDATHEGSFFLDPSGLAYLHGGVEAWGQAIAQRLRGMDLRASVITGFERARALAIARTHRGIWLVPSPEREFQLIAPLSLRSVGVPSSICDSLEELDLSTVVDLLAMDRGALTDRFGPLIGALHLALGGGQAPLLSPHIPHDPIQVEHHLEPPEVDKHRLLFRIKSMLPALLRELSQRALALQTLHLEYSLERGGTWHDPIQPASPTLELMQIMDLLRLRLESKQFHAPVSRLLIRLEGVHARRTQLELFRVHERRDLEAGAHALARVRALFGADSVTRACLQAAHLPEAGVQYERAESLRFPDSSRSPPPPDPPPLVRRLQARPIPLRSPDPSDPQRWPDLVERYGLVRQRHGPWKLSGGWWARTIERDYYYLETARGALLWVFHDHPRARWFLHGAIN